MTPDFGPTKYHYTLMAIKNHRVLKKQTQREVLQGRRMIQEIRRVLKNNRRKNERNIHTIKKQTTRHTGYHPTDCGVTTEF